MKRENRAALAAETVKIIEQGFYQIQNKKIDIAKAIDQSVADSRLYMPDDFNEVLAMAKAISQSCNYQTDINVENCSVLEAATKMLDQGKSRIGCLNFASAKNPGGGFLNGSQAQEESLARSSTLYASQMHHFNMYEYNRGRSTCLYSDAMIYSPGVMFIRDDEGMLLSAPYLMDVLTSPAVNISAMRSNQPAELPLVRQTMLARLDKILALFAANSSEHLLLGAWGCGVFSNEPADVADYFAHFLCHDGKYAKTFKSVFFAVLDRSKTLDNIKAFERRFA